MRWIIATKLRYSVAVTCADDPEGPGQARLYASDLLAGHGSGAAIELEAPRVMACRYLRLGWHRTPAVATRASPDRPGDHPNRRLSPLPRLREPCRDSPQRDIQALELSRQHESRLLIEVGDDSHQMGRDTIRGAMRSGRLFDGPARQL